MNEAANPSDWELLIYESAKKFETVTGAGPVELGRQAAESEALYRPSRKGDRWRVAVVPREERAVSRQHLLAEPLPGGRVRLTNQSNRLRIILQDYGKLEPHEQNELLLPVVMQLGSRTVRMQCPEAETEPLEQLDQPTAAPSLEMSTSTHFPLVSSDTGGPTAMHPEAMVRWFQTTLAVLYGAAFAADFYDRAAQAAVDLLALNTGIVLRRQDNAWVVAARAGDPDATPSQRILNRVLAEKRTFWQTPKGSVDASLIDLRVVVVAPILGRDQEVVGALYGARRLNMSMKARPLSRLEAMLMEVLAGSVATGLARVAQEEEALKARVLFGQFFTPGLALHLSGKEDLLAGRDTEVSVLVCDIRGFSRVSERLGPAKTVEWINAVMGALSDCVLAEEGVVVDYVGDELMAMWGAPVAQPDHAARACRAALAMLAQLPALDVTWGQVVGEPLEVTIGVNTGMARVGNVGSARKFKYGPLGNTVNLASRVQGATRHLKTRLLVTRSTQQQLPLEFQYRQVCQARLVGISEPVDLFELLGATPGARQAHHQQYEHALDQFVAGQFGTAVRLLGNVLIEHANDGPTLVLLSRAVNALVQGVPERHPVWELSGK